MELGSHPERIEVRYPFTGNILLNKQIMVKGIDVSMGGLYVYTGRSFARGMIVDVLVPDYNFIAKARVQHNQPGVGMGLKFLGMGEVLRNKLRLLIKSIDTGSIDLNTKTKPEVMLIDDNNSARRINKSKLSMEGFSVMETSSGIDAIKMMDERVPDLIVCDTQTEGIDGLKLLSVIRSTPALSKIPVIMLSAAASTDVIDKVYELGADEFMSKSTTSPAALAERVKGVLGKGD